MAGLNILKTTSSPIKTVHMAKRAGLARHKSRGHITDAIEVGFVRQISYKKEPQSQKIARTLPKNFLNNSRALPNKTRALRQIASESSPESSAKSLSQKFFGGTFSVRTPDSVLSESPFILQNGKGFLHRATPHFMADFSAKCSTLDNQHKSCGDSRSVSYRQPLLRDIPRVTDLDE